MTISIHIDYQTSNLASFLSSLPERFFFWIPTAPTAMKDPTENNGSRNHVIFLFLFFFLSMPIPGMYVALQISCSSIFNELLKDRQRLLCNIIESVTTFKC